MSSFEGVGGVVMMTNQWSGLHGVVFRGSWISFRSLELGHRLGLYVIFRL